MTATPDSVTTVRPITDAIYNRFLTSPFTRHALSRAFAYQRPLSVKVVRIGDNIEKFALGDETDIQAIAMRMAKQATESGVPIDIKIVGIHHPQAAAMTTQAGLVDTTKLLQEGAPAVKLEFSIVEGETMSFFWCDLVAVETDEPTFYLDIRPTPTK